jgi:hypothetical protein
MAREGMNVRGPCSSCGAQLASDQRYCVECGQRVGPPLALPYALTPAATATASPTGKRVLHLPIPPEMAGLFAALALGFGVVLGTAISPNLAGIIAAPSPPVVAEAPPETPSAAPSGGGGGSPAPAPAPAAAVASTTPTGSSGGGGGGGGSHKKKKKKKQKPEEGITFSGTVVRLNPVAQSYTVSTGGGLTAIHADTLPKVGDQVESEVRKLNNGTYAEDGSRGTTGTTAQASFQGTVTYCADLEHPTTPCSTAPTPGDHFVYAVSGLGASVLVSSPQGAPLPPVGSQVQVGVQIGAAAFSQIDPASPDDWTDYSAPCNPVSSEQNGVPAAPTTATELTQTSLTVNPSRESAILEAVVQETNCADGLVLSADDVREAGRDLLPLSVPAGIDQSRLARGQAVQVAVDLAGGSLTLTGITSDQGTGGADDPSQGQGTLTGS